MEEESYDVVVLGAGCGSAVGWRLALDGVRVLIVDRGNGGGSTVRNHRVKHSGAIQEGVSSARRLWHAFASMNPLELASLRSRGATFYVQRDRVDQALDRWAAAGIPFRRSRGAAPPCFAGDAGGAVGFAMPDSVIDYAVLVRELVRQAVANGAHVALHTTRTQVVLDGGRAVGVVVEEPARGARLVRFRHCIVAAGAWAPEVLAPAGISLPVERWKSHIVTLPDELVPRLTVSLGPSLLVVVPFLGETLVGDARRVPAGSGDDDAVEPALAAALRDDVGRVFPRLGAREIDAATVHAGIKTEAAGHGSRSQDIAVFDHRAHGVEGMTAVFPGKASLMFSLAEQMSAAVRRLPGRTTPPEEAP